MQGQVAVVTGGTGVLGAAIVQRLTEAGVRVSVPARTDVDLTDPTSVRAFFDGVVHREGRLDILVNCAGGFAMGGIDEDPGVWDAMMSSNATTAYLCCHAAVVQMKAKRRGRIINVASLVAVERGAANKSAYAASKAAVLSLTYSLAAELMPFGITANAIVPTVIDTPSNRKDMPDADTSTWLDPAEVAGVVAFLASDDARIVTGAALTLGLGAALG